MSAPARALAVDPVSTVRYDSTPSKVEAFASGVSWAAVAAGAFAAAALSLILLALGAGAGLSSISPFANTGASPAAVGVGALIYLCIVEVISSAIGGYLAGRLRTKWVDLHTDEVYFRDTAHGFLTWCVALVVSAAFLTAAAAGMVGERPAATTATASRGESAALDANRYYIDSLFRGGHATSVDDAGVRAQAAVVFAHALEERQLLSDDKNYVADLVAARTGLSHAEAENRVANVFERNQAAADRARKAVAHSLYWLFVALLLGAFTASLAATMGGRRRDHLPVTANAVA
jgi:hypothetical protein